MNEERLDILLVDDQNEDLLAHEAILAPLGQRIYKAKGGCEALRLVLERDFAAILLDVQMPGMDGFETADAIRAREKSRLTPILFLTGMRFANPDVFRGYTSGAVDYLVKPVDPEILRSKVDVFTRLARQRRELERVNAALADANRRLASTNQDLDAFSRRVSHDLQGPIAVIDGFARIVAEEGKDSLGPTNLEYLGVMRKAAARMGELVRDLLQLSRVTHGELAWTEVDLAEMALPILLELRRSSPGRVVETTVASRLPVRADAKLVKIALENLIGNAWKYTSKRERSKIEVGREPDGRGQTVFFVRDDGIGFDPRKTERMFQPFERFHSADEYPGTGVGLATVQRIVERHGGRIWARSAPGEGATFYFTLESEG
ncbi:MAG: response regulator [Planctomycetes bacterium]|nr:response regulator [Planctomycetota bacterium]